MFDAKRFILEKWFFPKVIIINNPGVIVTKVVRKYGRADSRNRPVYIFEDVV